TDVGAIGPDRARGGLYLLLPPDYDGPVPQGYYAFKSSTYNVFLKLGMKREHMLQQKVEKEGADQPSILP
ncbi:hypothetical protein MJM83_29065, partial [Salmonella enterica subsp. enterica serovar Montevideo]|nr:hypothetical protein [Salmonella enterica subsp. enterica serovar Montevideo]